MMHRIRLATQTKTFAKLSGEVEADETFISGKARNMHPDERREKITGTGSTGKVAVMGLLERHGRVHTKVVPNIRKKKLQAEVRENVQRGSKVFTDALASYDGLERDYIHQVIDHAEAYARGNVHTNGLENFWSLLKRGIRGTYVSVEPFHTPMICSSLKWLGLISCPPWAFIPWRTLIYTGTVFGGAGHAPLQKSGMTISFGTRRSGNSRSHLLIMWTIYFTDCSP
jgi:transposase-like protein